MGDCPPAENLVYVVIFWSIFYYILFKSCSLFCSILLRGFFAGYVCFLFCFIYLFIFLSIYFYFYLFCILEFWVCVYGLRPLRLCVLSIKLSVSPLRKKKPEAESTNYRIQGASGCGGVIDMTAVLMMKDSRRRTWVASVRVTDNRLTKWLNAWWERTLKKRQKTGIRKRGSASNIVREVKSTNQEGVRSAQPTDLCFAICRFSHVRFITPSHLSHNLFFYFQ